MNASNKRDSQLNNRDSAWVEISRLSEENRRALGEKPRIDVMEMETNSERS
jgi:hypothetical protein